jgi:hypothetical protein
MRRRFTIVFAAFRNLDANRKITQKRASRFDFPSSLSPTLVAKVLPSNKEQHMDKQQGFTLIELMVMINSKLLYCHMTKKNTQPIDFR